MRGSARRDNRGSIWVTDDTYNSLIRFDVVTKKFTYYPLPQVRWSVPKVEIGKDGSVWFGSRGIQTIVGVNFKPKGKRPEDLPSSGARRIRPIADRRLSRSALYGDDDRSEDSRRQVWAVVRGSGRDRGRLSGPGDEPHRDVAFRERHEAGRGDQAL